MPEKFQPSEKVTNMNFDKGWKRLEKLLLLLGALPATSFFITNGVPKHGDGAAIIFLCSRVFCAMARSQDYQVDY